ncbi:MAG: cell division protein FtsZ [Candidatus Vogelbacteria bacterium RIFOXYD1_FULL_44_32]|uniref:Cell division protein FtsZ n=1 Tax=Candidatus Vogelbacteria bacterium RIFOXYD1_FULL_44_32 TaxID=1802438 RepID=A0A1G2QD61_9BACT|nr:MAG: cell division protein FtsZ [Candidatus Vogelbacteria bacterium RIFOXYD1_FULL_44_32]
MPKIQPEIEAFARIKVIGVGGSGTNAVNHMVNAKVRGVEFVAMNTDAQHLHASTAQKKVHVGKNLTRGLGTGMDPEIGRKAAEESLEDIQNVIKGADMVFVSCGLGGGTGTGAAPVIARTAKEQGALTVAVVTKPFIFEGKHRMMLADRGLAELQKEVDAVIVIPNDRLLGIISKDTTAESAFAMCDEILRQAVEGISNIITIPGIINVDFADIRAIMQNAGSALMGIGHASGENRAVEAARNAINSPLLDLSVDGAKGVLFTIAGGSDMTMFEIQEAAKVITESIDQDAKVIFGAIHDDKLKKSEIKVTVIACGFPESQKKKSGLFGFDTTSKEGETKDNRGTPASTPNPGPTRPAPPRTQVIDPEKPETEEEDDDWSSIPAFLRRGKK